jgi:zeta-carotene desaturase
MPRVVIVGAGIAGLTAALRLAERGYEVTVFDQDEFVGGKFRATRWIDKATRQVAYHEHSYHMFLNWYHNFWRIADDIGARKGFVPLTRVLFLDRNEFPRMRQLVNFGSLAAIPQNLLSGVLPISDMLLYMYSVLDLLSTPMGQSRYRDLISVNGFASTRPYATEASVKLYDEYLAKTFAITSYQSSAKTFQTFLEYGTYCPDPLYWALTGNSYEMFLRLFEDKLHRLNVRFERHHEAIKLELDGKGNVSSIIFRNTRDFNPSLSEMSTELAIKNRLLVEEETLRHTLDGPVILAVPPAALERLLSADILNRNPELGESWKLRSVPMASIHLHLNEKFRQRLKEMKTRLPREPVVLVNSKYKLSFVANSSLWRESRGIYLNVVASDSRPLEHLLAPKRFTEDRDRPDGDEEPGLAIARPVTTLDHILHEFRRFVHFEDDEIDGELLHIDRNAGRELFINEVGSWAWRPETRTKVHNLFLAGDFCKNIIDVVCLEGAVVSGLQAAELVRREYGIGTPIRIARPRRYPYPIFWPLKISLAPYAAAAKIWSVFKDISGRLGS